jgi:hypothetical protein
MGMLYQNAHSYGWRMQSEVLTLGLSQIDVSRGAVWRPAP